MAREYQLKQRLPEQPSSGIDYAAELNEKQFAAVTAPPGPSLVIAGAGSGKTRTLTYRVAYLLDNGVRASNILLLTFTNKAAREMLARVSELVPHDTRDLWGGTFHSVGNRILRRHAEQLGWDRSFSILDRDDQKELLSAVLAKSGIDVKGLRFPKPEVLGDIFSLARNTRCGLDELLRRRYPYFIQFEEMVRTIERGYEKRKLETNAMDFDDLLEKALRLFKEYPALREQYQKRFEWVLVDEYQDTNALQAELIDLLGAPQHNVMVVGDDAQSIYSWRGADFRNILEFNHRYPKAERYVIETNYRSVPQILSLANAAIAANTLQIPKDLSPARPEAAERPGLVALADPNTQADFIAQRIRDLHDEGIPYEEMAVLYRAHFHAMEVQLTLTRHGIPFVITSGLRFFEQAHVKDVSAFMKFVFNRRDELSYRRVVMMLPGIGQRSADRLWSQWLELEREGGRDPGKFSDALLKFDVPAKARSAWEQLVFTLDELVEADGTPLPAAKMMDSILGGVYEDYMKAKFTNYDSRKQDLQQMQRYAEQFDELEEFLSQLSLLAGQDAVAAASEEDEGASVCLSSVHQAKGLEWKVVFVIWLTDGMFPNNRVIENDPGEEGLEEERRLFYVAVTRARDALYLTYPEYWPNSFSGDVCQAPSRFLEEIPPGCMEQWNVGSSW